MSNRLSHSILLPRTRIDNHHEINIFHTRGFAAQDREDHKEYLWLSP